MLFKTLNLLLRVKFEITASYIKYRSSSPKVFLGQGVLKMCNKFTGEHPYQSAILIESQSNFIEIAPWRGCSHVILLHIFRTPFSKNTSGELLLKMLRCGYGN